MTSLEMPSIVIGTSRLVAAVGLIFDPYVRDEHLRAANSVSGALQNGPWHGSNGVITEGSENPASNNDDKGFRGTSTISFSQGES